MQSKSLYWMAETRRHFRPHLISPNSIMNMLCSRHTTILTSKLKTTISLFPFLETEWWMLCKGSGFLLNRWYRRSFYCSFHLCKLNHECLAKTVYPNWIDLTSNHCLHHLIPSNWLMNVFSRPGVCIESLKLERTPFLSSFLKSQSWMLSADRVRVSNRAN